MACRCRDISDYDNDLKLLGEAQTTLSAKEADLANIQTYLTDIATTSSESYIASNIVEICTKIRELDDDAETAMSDFAEALGLKIEETEELKKEAEEEDAAFHRAQEEAENAAEETTADS